MKHLTAPSERAQPEVPLPRLAETAARADHRWRRAVLVGGAAAAVVACVARAVWWLFPPPPLPELLSADVPPELRERLARAAAAAEGVRPGDTVYLVDTDQLDANAACVRRWAEESGGSGDGSAALFFSLPAASGGRHEALSQLAMCVRGCFPGDDAPALVLPCGCGALPAEGAARALAGCGVSLPRGAEVVRLVRHAADARALAEAEEGGAGEVPVVAHVDALFRPGEHTLLGRLTARHRMWRRRRAAATSSLRSPADVLRFADEVAALGGGRRLRLCGFYVDCNYERARLGRGSRGERFWAWCLRFSRAARHASWETATRQQAHILQWLFYFFPSTGAAAAGAEGMQLLANWPDGMWAPPAEDDPALRLADSGEAAWRPVARVLPLALLLCGEYRTASDAERSSGGTVTSATYRVRLPDGADGSDSADVAMVRHHDSLFEVAGRRDSKSFAARQHVFTFSASSPSLGLRRVSSF